MQVRVNALHTATGSDLTVTQLYGLLTLRVNVFVVEQGCPYPELDGHDLRADTTHLWWQPASATAPLAYLRVLGGEVQRIGRVCTAASARNAGLSGRLMAAALDRIGAAESVLDAQLTVQTMYARFGYVAEGEPFVEDGIPHIRMRRGTP